MPGELVAAPHGGAVCELSSADLAALRLATANRQPPTAPGASDGRQPRQAPTAKRQTDDADGWAELVAELRSERDRLRSELESERVGRAEAARRAEEAERGRHAAEQRLEVLRAAWWRWYALARRPWWRVRPLPDPPAELVADRLLAPPVDRPAAGCPAAAPEVH